MESNIKVAQKAVLVREDGKILAIRRSKTAPSRPLNWDLPGGTLNFGEEVKAGLLREIKEETGLEIRDLRILDAASVEGNNGDFWVVVGYAARPIGEAVVLSFEHDQFQWVTPEEFQLLEASPRNKLFVEKFKTSLTTQ